METPSHVVFAGPRRIAYGPLAEVLPILKRRYEEDEGEGTLVFELESGRQVEFDLRASLEEILLRELPSVARGPGRPRLGVTGREVSLLPRHWEWLEQQPNGASAALRRLVDAAIKTEPGRQQARRMRAALSQILTAIAGNRPHFEEACRALFAGDTAALDAATARWPKDVREFATEHARQAVKVER